MTTLSLTPFERTVLANQFKMLAALDPRERDEHTAAAEVFEQGFTHFYRDHAPAFAAPEVSAQKIEDILELLLMFRCINNALGRGVDITGIEPDRLRFIGFDGNNETTEQSLARYMGVLKGWYSESLIPGLNSHGPTLDRYARQLHAWRQLPHSKTGAHLTRGDLQILAAAVTYPRD